MHQPGGFRKGLTGKAAAEWVLKGILEICKNITGLVMSSDSLTLITMMLWCPLPVFLQTPREVYIFPIAWEINPWSRLDHPIWERSPCSLLPHECFNRPFLKITGCRLQFHWKNVLVVLFPRFLSKATITIPKVVFGGHYYQVLFCQGCLPKDSCSGEGWSKETLNYFLWFYLYFGPCISLFLCQTDIV